MPDRNSSEVERRAGPTALEHRPRPFIIFAGDRSGSTTLCHALAAHPEVSCAFEPFNHNSGGPHLRPATVNELRLHLDMLYNTYSGFKHVWYWNGWPFEDPSFHERVLTQGRPRVIFLNRSNVFQRALSHYISTQTNVWHVSGVRDRGRDQISSSEMAPVDPEWMKAYIDGHHAAVARYRNILETSGADWIDLDYEDLYHPSLRMPARVTVFEHILEFIGASPLGSEKQFISRLLSPKVSKVNSQSTYHRIPNIAEIEKMFACAENGFREDSPTYDGPGLRVHLSSSRSAPDNIVDIPEAERAAALKAQFAYLQGVVQEQENSVRGAKQSLSAPYVRAAAALLERLERRRPH